ncbi:sufurtransferase FdhD [Hahella sp. CCB-MM4]|uniref:formate dehydrogenase accessory sulfurtransferase FdhD n=1 Tax=Hahella sp. (strain CCB-MM4) TaxID=1926491 RepID=UPI000B9A82CE|nr:formate dehydrogenase accessory sulfurtransferase FdhD [Hahella sp. CCB-MM4]OZG70087.1 sufurtransferase FdhD [Hahella sp. CCB-MM4]
MNTKDVQRSSIDHRQDQQEAGFLSTGVSVALQSGESWETEELMDFVVEERPVALVYNGISHAVMMATPTDLEDFALGFSLSENIIQHQYEMFSCELEGDSGSGLQLQMHIHGERLQSLKSRHRAMAGPTGCGLCGKRSLEETQRKLPVLHRRGRPTPSVIQHAIQSIGNGQRIQLMTGACHAAAWMDGQGNLLLIREDVGRHNALDKLIGALVQQKVSLDEGFLLVTSRASYEMVYKAVTVGITSMVAVSGATGMAVDTARHSGMNLIGFARQGRQVVYC